MKWRPLIPDGRPNEHGNPNMEILFSFLIIIIEPQNLEPAIGIACFIVLCFITFFRYCVFSQVEDLWQACIEQVCQYYFSNSICSLCVSLSHFGNFCNVSNFIGIIFVMMRCDQ